MDRAAVADRGVGLGRHRPEAAALREPRSLRQRHWQDAHLRRTALDILRCLRRALADGELLFEAIVEPEMLQRRNSGPAIRGVEGIGDRDAAH